MLTRRKKFAAHICSLCTDFYQLGCTEYQSHRSPVGSQREVRARETERAQGGTEREWESKRVREKGGRGRRTTANDRKRGREREKSTVQKTEKDRKEVAMNKRTKWSRPATLSEKDECSEGKNKRRKKVADWRQLRYKTQWCKTNTRRMRGGERSVWTQKFVQLLLAFERLTLQHTPKLSLTSTHTHLFDCAADRQELLLHVHITKSV